MRMNYLQQTDNRRCRRHIGQRAGRSTPTAVSSTQIADSRTLWQQSRVHPTILTERCSPASNLALRSTFGALKLYSLVLPSRLILIACFTQLSSVEFCRVPASCRRLRRLRISRRRSFLLLFTFQSTLQNES